MWLPPFSHLGVRRDSPDPDTAEAERAGFCPPTQSSSKTEKRTKVVQQIYAKLRLKQPVLSPEMILASGRAGQQGCSTRSWNGAAAPQRRGREWESPGCRDGEAVPETAGREVSVPRRCGGRHRLALGWKCLNISVNHPLQLPKGSREVLQTHT